MPKIETAATLQEGLALLAREMQEYLAELDAADEADETARRIVEGR